MKKPEIFKTNQDYLGEFFNLAGAQKRSSWEPPEAPAPAAKKTAPKPVKVPPKEEVIKNFQLKVKRTLKAGVDLPLEALAKKHKLSFIEKAILAYFAGTELYRAHLELGGLIGRFESKGIAPAFETAKLISPASTLMRKNLIAPSPNNYPGRFIDEIIMPPKIFTLITGVPLRKEAKKRRQTSYKDLLSPSQICEALEEYVVGQEQAKKAVSTGLYLHVKRTKLNKKRPEAEKITKSNILMIGPTGSGKTHICRTLSNTISMPFHIADATQYTETGYVGRTVEEMLLDLHKGRNLAPGASAIIYIDEIDKIAAQNPGDGHYGANRDVSGKSVQEELLKLLEGTEITCERQRGHGAQTIIDASNILFIGGGAFQGLEEIIKERLKKKGIGFRGASAEDKSDTGSLLRQVMTEDLIAYGFMPEFIGRFPIIAVLDQLTKADLVNIITGTRNSILSQYKAVIDESGLDIKIPPDMPEIVAEAALKRNLGARAIKGIMEKWLMDEIFKQTGSRPAGPADGPEEKKKTIGD